MDAPAYRVIDFHAHAFPDELARRAIPLLEANGSVTAVLDGTVAGLIASMDRAGIERAVLASVATKPKQFDSILSWSLAVASPRIVPFPSVHPDDPQALERLRLIAKRGFRGVKLHPYYQGFTLDEERLLPLYRTIRDLGLVLLCHTGFDIGYERTRIADPQKTVHILELFPDLRLVTTHLGAWDDWDEVERLLIGRPVTLDIAYVAGFMDPARLRRLLLRHPADRVLFGSDSPWADQARTLHAILELDLPPERLEALLGGNASVLLASGTSGYSSPLR